MKRSRGLSLVETIVAAALTALVLGAAVRLAASTQDLAASIGNSNVADQRAARAIASIVASTRAASLSNIRHLDGTAFEDGQTDEGIVVAPVCDWNGAAVAAAPLRFERIGAAGAERGDIVRSQGAGRTTIASNVAAFRVTRSGAVFLVEITALAGPRNDRARGTRAQGVAVPRNP